MSGGGNEGSGSSWGSRFWKGVSAVAASAAVAGDLYAALSSSASANSELEASFGARREHKEDDDGYPFSPHPKASSQVEVWKKPEIGWVKLNVDGSRDHYGPSAGCGGVFRDASGAWLCGFALKLDPSYEAQETELRAILEGMQLASKMKFETSEMKFEKLIVESDNKDVVRMVVEDKLKFKKDSRTREYEFVKSIRDLLINPKWQVELVYISGKANRVADRLANIARTLSFDDLQEYHLPPDRHCESLLSEDIKKCEGENSGSLVNINIPPNPSSSNQNLKRYSKRNCNKKLTMSGGGNEGSGSSWESRFLKGASVVAASAAVAGGLYALLSSSASANSELEAPFGARREHKEDDDDYPFSPHPKASSQVEVWKKPEIGWVKLNVDGSRDHYGPSTGCGGVFRDASRAWLCGFALKLDPSYEAQETELRAILEGMQLASKMKFETSEMKFEKLIVESDNREMVRMVVEDTLKFKEHSRPREYELVKSIRDLLSDPKWQVELVSISRDANGVANSLARKACTLSSDDLQKYLSPPDGNIKSIHLKDIGQDRVSKT